MSNQTNESLDSQEAKMLLTHPLLKKAFSEVRESFVEAIEGNDMDNVHHANQLALSLQVLNDVKTALYQFVETGIMKAKFKPPEDL